MAPTEGVSLSTTSSVDVRVYPSTINSVDMGCFPFHHQCGRYGVSLSARTQCGCAGCIPLHLQCRREWCLLLYGRAGCIHLRRHYCRRAGCLSLPLAVCTLYLCPTSAEHTCKVYPFHRQQCCSMNGQGVTFSTFTQCFKCRNAGLYGIQ
jgi:hypothetical protein